MADLDLVLKFPKRRMNCAFSERAEAHGGDEMFSALGEHWSDLMPRLLEEPDQLERLIGGDAAADDEEHARHLLSLAQTAAARRSPRRSRRPAHSPTRRAVPSS